MDITSLLEKVKSHPPFFASAAILLLLTVLFSSYLHLLMIPFFFLAGVATSHLLFDQTTLLPNLLYFNERKRLLESGHNEDTNKPRSCSVCGKMGCQRHKVGLPVSVLQPWTDINLPQRVDMALSEVFELVLEKFVYIWYSELGGNEEFVTELRNCLRFFTAVLVKRVQQVDIPTLVTDKLLKAGITHLDCYLRARKIASKFGDGECGSLEDLTLKLYGGDLHRAVRSRAGELQYIRSLLERLFPHIIPQKMTKSRAVLSLLRETLAGSVVMPAMDVVANPDMVNKLLLIFFDEEQMVDFAGPASPTVTLLEDFANTSKVKNQSALRMELMDILGQSEMLYPFMTFMRNEGCLNLLQFCLTIEDFNKRSLVPDMTSREMKELHAEANELYNMYFKEGAVDNIQFTQEIVDQVKQVAEGSFECVVKLRTTSCLYKAYEHVFNQLETVFCPLFYHSDEFYNWLCGERLSVLQRTPSSPDSPPPQDSSSPPSSPSQPLLPSSQSSQNLQRGAGKRSSEPFSAVTKLGSKIKGVFTANSANAIANDGDGDTELVDSEAEEAREAAGVDDEGDRRYRSLHDLSTWRVFIPRIGLRQTADMKSTSLEKYFVYVVQVRRLDVTEGGGGGEGEKEQGSWEVERRYHEFYVLEAKLTEFHGVLGDCRLPPKRPFASKTREFIQDKLVHFEKYLQTLLTKPQLKGSELLQSFLSSKDEFVDKLLPEVNLGRMFRSMKIIKQKGQNLEFFLQSFVTSTEAPKPRSIKPENKDKLSSPKSLLEKNANPVFGDNAGHLQIDYNEEPPDNIPILQLNGAFDYIFYLARRVYQVLSGVDAILVAARMIIKNTLETYLDSYLTHKISQIEQEDKLEHLIHLFRDAVFFDNNPPRMDDEKRERREETFREMKRFIPKVFAFAVGDESHHEGTKVIFDLLQMPKLNKQLLYVLLDIVLLELFPEFEKPDDIKLPLKK